MNQFESDYEGFESENPPTKKQIIASSIYALCRMVFSFLPLLVLGENRMRFTSVIPFKFRPFVLFPLLGLINYGIIKGSFFLVNIFIKLDRCLQYIIEM